MSEELYYIKNVERFPPPFFYLHIMTVGFPIAIPLRAIGRNCSLNACNCAKLRANFRSLQGSQLRASKIHLRWKP